MTPSHSYRSSPTDIEMTPWLPVGLWFALKQWKVPFMPCGRHLPHWANLDLHLQASGKLDFHLFRQLTAYAKQDPLPLIGKPILFPLISQTAHLHYMAQTSLSLAVVDMLLLGFFFLLHPGEYAHMSNLDATRFCLCDTHLLINNWHLFLYICSMGDLRQVNYITLDFTS